MFVVSPHVRVVMLGLGLVAGCGRDATNYPADVAASCNDAGHEVTLDPCACGDGEHCAPVLAPSDVSGCCSRPGSACVADAATPHDAGDSCATLSVSAGAYVYGGCGGGGWHTGVTVETSTCGAGLVCVTGVCRVSCDAPAAPTDCASGLECTPDTHWLRSACSPPMADAGGIDDAGIDDADIGDADIGDAG